MKLTYEIDIKATTECVWSWLGTPERAMKWQTSISGGEILHQTPNMIGTTFREIVEEDGRTTEMHGVITDYQKNKRLAMHSSGKYNVVDVEWYLEPVGEHTQLIFKADVRFKSVTRILSILMRPMFKRKISQQLKDELANLKKLCESDD